MKAPRMPDGSAGFVAGTWCEKRAAALEADADAERAGKAAAAASAAKSQVDAAATVAAAGDAPLFIWPKVAPLCKSFAAQLVPHRMPYERLW